MASPYHTHGAGRLALLRLRGRDQFATLDGANLFLISYLEQLIGSVETRSGEVLDDAPEWISHAFAPPRPIVSHALLMHSISGFLKELKDTLGKEIIDHGELLELFRRGIEIDSMASDLHQIFTHGRFQELHRFYQSMDTWRKRTSSTSCTNVSSDPSMPESYMDHRLNTSSMDFDTETTDSMDELTIFLISVTTATMGNMCRAVRIHLIHDLLAAIPHLHATSAVSLAGIDLEHCRDRWNSVVALSAAEIYENIPYAFGECDATGKKPAIPVTGMIYRAYLSLWPIRTALNAPQTPTKYKQLLAAKLMHMSDVMGIGMASEVLADAERSAID